VAPDVAELEGKSRLDLPIRGGSFAAVENWENCPPAQAKGQWPLVRTTEGEFVFVCHVVMSLNPKRDAIGNPTLSQKKRERMGHPPICQLCRV
jgi:hypothetical protein